MQLLIITRYYPPAIDGVGDHSYHLKKSLEELGWQVHIFTVAAAPLPAFSDEISVVPAFNSRMLLPLKTTIARFGITHVLWQYVPNSFHARGLPLYLPALMRAVGATGIRQFVFFHEVALRKSGYGWRQWYKGSLQLRLALQLQSIAQASITSIPLYAQMLAQPYPHLVAIGANILPAETGQATTIHLANSHLKPPPRQLFCFTNRLSVVLLQALAQLPAHHHCQLVVAGKADATHIRHLQQWIATHQLQHKVLLKGTLTPAALATLMQQADVVLQPEAIYHQQQGGISAKNGTLAAAWAFGKIVIATAGDMTDTTLFKHGQNCLLLSQNGVEEWQSAISAALTMPPESIRQMQVQVQQTYRQHVSWQAIGRQIHQILTNSIA